LSRIGVVAIGRNEGERLRHCLQSLDPPRLPIVYVDSGSTDGSAETARSLGVSVVDLDLSLPFTAARARNAGFEQLMQIAPAIEFVQFVDGDCEVVGGWLGHATAALNAKPQVAVACGRRRERHPEASISNRLCDIEWDTPIGEANACGGDALMRVAAFQQIGGFNPTLIAGEEPELCGRLRQNGWKILRIDAEMTLHDAAMTRFSQWWKRAVRAGHAYAEGASLHGRSPQRHFVRERRRMLIWGLLLPVVLLAGIPFCYGWSLLGFWLYPIWMIRIAWKMRKRLRFRHSLAWGVSCMASKVPEFVGLCKFYSRKLRGRQGLLIEYK
jgi:GT2 family glycosyltransferase